MQEQIDKCAKALTAYGVRKGDVVSLCVLAMPEAVYLLYAINKIGAIANMLVLNATEAELHEKMLSTESKFVLTVNLVLGKIMQAAKGTSIEHIVGISLFSYVLCLSCLPILHQVNEKIYGQSNIAFVFQAKYSFFCQSPSLL